MAHKLVEVCESQGWGTTAKLCALLLAVGAAGACCLAVAWALGGLL